MRSAAVQFVIRPMLEADIPQVVDIERESFPTMWPQTAYKRELRNRLARYFVVTEPPEPESAPPPEPAAPTDEGLWARFRRRLPGGPPVPPTRERIVGFVGLWLMMGQAHIVTIATREALRRSGIGELLLITTLETAVQEEQEVVTLEYRRSNEAARSLYEKYGFTQSGVRRRYYADDHEDAVIMTTPSILTPEYRALLRERKEAHRQRWPDLYA